MDLVKGLKEYSVNIDDQCQINFKCKFVPDSTEVILFIHGLACSLDSFRNVFDRDYFPDKSLLLIDLLGFGKSSKFEDFSYTMEDQARIIEKLLALIPKWGIHIAAHSMGGAVALLFQPKTFDRILSFANIEGNLISEDCGALSRGIASMPYQEYKSKLYGKQVVEFKGHQQLRFEETVPFAVYKSSVSLVHWSDSCKLYEKFINLNCRNSYFFGEENKNMQVISRLNSIKKYMITKSGHGMMTDNPVEFYSKLADFIYQKD